MESLRYAPEGCVPSLEPCCRCQQSDRRWDRIAGKAYCPNCQEALAQGQAPPLVERTHRHQCTICHQVGTVAYQTMPLNEANPVEMNLCPEHLRGLIGRRLGPHAYYQLCRQLTMLGLGAGQVFLLHDAFYDENGQALQPALEVD